MKHIRYAALAALLLLTALPVYAQHGCSESPEDPTAVLALLGTAGASVVFLRDRFKSRTAR